MKTPEHLVEEQRNAAIHEAGHLVILRRFGGDGENRIWPNPDSCSYQVAWFGQCVIHAEPVEPSANWELFFGMAGIAAECIDEIQDDPEWLFEQLKEFIDLGVLSKSDAALVGDGPVSDDDIRRLIAMLRENWPDVLVEAEYLMALANATYGRPS